MRCTEFESKIESFCQSKEMRWHRSKRKGEKFLERKRFSIDNQVKVISHFWREHALRQQANTYPYTCVHLGDNSSNIFTRSTTKDDDSKTCRQTSQDRTTKNQRKHHQKRLKDNRLNWYENEMHDVQCEDETSPIKTMFRLRQNRVSGCLKCRIAQHKWSAHTHTNTNPRHKHSHFHRNWIFFSSSLRSFTFFSIYAMFFYFISRMKKCWSSFIRRRT